MKTKPSFVFLKRAPRLFFLWLSGDVTYMAKGAKGAANEEEEEGPELDEVEVVREEDEERPPLLTRCLLACETVRGGAVCQQHSQTRS